MNQYFYSKNKNFFLEPSQEIGHFKISSMNHTIGQYNSWRSITSGYDLKHSIKELRELRDMLTEFLGE